MAMSPSSIEGTILAGTDDAESHQSHPLAGLGALLATPQSAALVVTAFLLAATMYILSDRAKANRTEKHWDEVCRQVLRERDEVGHEVLGKAYSGAADDAGDILKKSQEAEDTRIARMRGTELMAAMLEGSLSSERTVAAFSRRSRAIGSEKHQAVTEEFYDEAVQAAAVVDEGRRRGGAGTSSSSSNWQQSKSSVGGSGDCVVGVGGRRVLEGMPISVKDSIHMEGALTTCGMACKAALGPSVEDGLLVRVLRAHGAIPFVRGNVPQCLMLPESHNAIFGKSENPWKLGRTPGGSSGGEACLVSLRCAPLALGSDVGGSIRIPCHFTGTCGLKPTPERMSSKGMATLSEDGKCGQRIIQVCAGPIANSVDDLNLAMTALCSRAMWDGDASLPRLPWDDDLAKNGLSRPLKVGFFTTDHWFQPCTAVTRAVHEAAEGLRAKGHVVVPFEPPVSGWEIARLYYGQMGAEGNMKRFVDSLKGERMLPGYASLRRIASIPNFLRPFLSWVLRVVVKDYRKASLLGVTRDKGLSVRQYYELVGETFRVRSQWEAAVANAGLDAVISPVAALPALPHGASKDLTPAFTYTFVANLLHWPAGTVPVTVVRPEEEDYDIASIPVMQRDVTARFARAACKGSAGLPVGVQVMTTPYQEELAIHVMREVERAVKFDAVPNAAGL